MILNDPSNLFATAAVGVASLVAVLALIRGMEPALFYTLHYYNTTLVFLISSAILMRQAYVVKGGLATSERTDVYTRDVVDDEYEKFQMNTLQKESGRRVRDAVAGSLDDNAEDFYDEHGDTDVPEPCKDKDDGLSCRLPHEVY
tara:strand:+ start:851 stop:1282 length:432 start_codon:yes stop_codon:yes gene_type:complete